MNTSSVKDLKKELQLHSREELVEYCMKLARFKKDNKEVLHYLLFGASDPVDYIKEARKDISDQFQLVNMANSYWIKKGVRKILRNVNKYIRFISSKEAEVQLLTEFCNGFVKHGVPVSQSVQLRQLYLNQQKKIEAALERLHPDLQFDLRRELLSF